MSELNVIIYSMLLSLSIVIVFLGYFCRNEQYKHIMRNRIKRINRTRFLKMYGVILGVLLLASKNGSNFENKEFTWLDAIALSIFISFLIMYHAVSKLDLDEKEREIYYDENVKKAFDRDKKLNSILKKGLW